VGGTLYVVATPIGNLEDITLRAVRVLGEVDLVAAEDTRSARVLLSRHGVQTPTLSLFTGNEARRSEQVIARLRRGERVALISEAGTPGISDPGERLIARCVAAGVPVDMVPGPSAVVSALVLSGLPTRRFLFEGFLPRRGRERGAALARVVGADQTVVIYESPRRLAATLAELARDAPQRPAAVVREITKVHQEVVRDALTRLAARYAEAAPRGEITLVIGPRPEPEPMGEHELTSRVRALLARGESPREVADALRVHGRRRVYQLALRCREEA